MYNCTPLHRLNWQTPHQLLYQERPSVKHLHVFSCGAYVFIPAEIIVNKLTPKSQLMTYLGNAPGANSFMFMRKPNNVLFYATHCIFDETMLPSCKALKKWPNTRVRERTQIPTKFCKLIASSSLAHWHHLHSHMCSPPPLLHHPIPLAPHTHKLCPPDVWCTIPSNIANHHPPHCHVYHDA